MIRRRPAIAPLVAVRRVRYRGRSPRRGFQHRRTGKLRLEHQAAFLSESIFRTLGQALAQLAFEDLAADVLRDLFHEDDLLGGFEAGEALPAGPDDVGSVAPSRRVSTAVTRSPHTGSGNPMTAASDMPGTV